MLKNSKIETIKEVFKGKTYLFWDLLSIDGLSIDSMFERIINYGDWEDVITLFQILGIKESAAIFHNNSKLNKRSNYLPKIENYFNLFFQKYA